MTSKWFRFEEAFIHVLELSYMWSGQLLVSVCGLCVCDSHKGRARFEADSALLGG